MKEMVKNLSNTEGQLINDGNRKSPFDSNIIVINSDRSQERMLRMVSKGLVGSKLFLWPQHKIFINQKREMGGGGGCFLVCCCCCLFFVFAL